MTDMTMALTDYYAGIELQAGLRTAEHAHRWSAAVLRTLGFTLRRSPKNDLAQALPEELAEQIQRSWVLISFFNPRLTQEEFLKQIARRGGNTDGRNARHITTAVLDNVKKLIEPELSDEVARSLPDDIGDLWREA